VINSLIAIGLILNQNESAKDATSNTTSELANPLQNITWFCVALEFILLLAQFINGLMFLLERIM
jgi:hypothetical protein